MKKFHAGSIVLLLFAFDLTWSRQLSEQQRSKLHPIFQSIVSEGVKMSGAVKAIPSLREPSGISKQGDPIYDAIIYTNNREELKSASIQVNSSFANFVTSQITAADILKLVNMQPVEYIDPGTINYPQLDVSVSEIGVSLLHAGFINNTPYKGKDAIVLIYDTGIDWKHLDFRDPADPTKSRILFIWDQTITATQPGELAPSGFSYGVEYTQAQINDEIDGSPTAFVRESDINGHGTHVAGTAAGNGASLTKKYTGVAPEADIIVVKGGDESFSEAKMIDGLSYAQKKTALLGKPIVVNWSIGGQVGPHDGSRPHELAVNSFGATPGRLVCIAAGNDGGSLIHTSGTVSVGTSTSISLSVPAYSPISGASNDQFVLDIWFNSNPSITATVTTPSNSNYSSTASTSEGTIDIFNGPGTSNGNRNVQVWVRDAGASVPASGTWTLTFSNSSGPATFDAWLAFSSFAVTLNGSDNDKSVSLPGTSEGGITVGAYVTKYSWPTYDGRTFGYTGTDRTSNISTFSGIGPTADARQKPDIAAPGQGIVSSLSTGSDTTGDAGKIAPGQKHWILSGTSMATPHVAGVVALLLADNPALTAAQVKSLLTSTANVDPFTGSIPNFTWGYGKIDALEAMAKNIKSGASASREVLTYDVVSTNQIVTLTGSTKYAIRFSPSISGRLTGIQLNVTTQNNNPIQGTGPLKIAIFSNTTGSVAGVPGTQIGSIVDHPFSQLSPGTNNYIDMLSGNVDVTAGTDYHAVVYNTNSSDVLLIRTDNASSGTNRSSVFNGSTWYNFSDGLSGVPSGVVNANLRMKAVVTLLSGVSSVEQLSDVPLDFELRQNFPNPFNPATTIHFSNPF